MTINKLDQEKILNSIAVSTKNLIVNLDAGNTASYSGSGSIWTNLVNNTEYEIIDGSFDNTDEISSIAFNGTSTHVNIGTVLSNGTSFTKEAWVLYNIPFNGVGNILSSEKNVFYVNNSKLAGGIENNFDHVKYLNNFPIGEWKHIVLTSSNWGPSGHGGRTEEGLWINGANIRLYVDGTLVRVHGNVFESYVSGDEYIGCHPTEGNLINFWNGRIAEVRVYNDTLDAQQVGANFNATKSKYLI